MTLQEAIDMAIKQLQNDEGDDALRARSAVDILTNALQEHVIPAPGDEDFDADDNDKD